MTGPILRARRMAVLAALLVLGFAGPAAAMIAVTPWGTLPSGENVDLYTLLSASGAEARIITYGGRLVSLSMPDRNGHFSDVVEGYDSLGDYLTKGGIYGALVGRYANRIAGSRFTLEGKTYDLAPTGGGLTIHGGPVGFAKRVWTATPHDGADPSLTLTLVSADGDQGFPGTLHVTATYTLTRNNVLRIEYRATTDKPTVANLMNHSFFNLQSGGNVNGYDVQIFAHSFTVDGPQTVPTGEIRPVAGTAFDFLKPTVIGPRLDSTDPQIAAVHGYDHNFVIDGKPGTLRIAARVHDPVSGRVLEAWTTQPGMQLYTVNGGRSIMGAGGIQMGRHTAICLETQHFPNAPNQPNFPSTEVTPGKPLHEITEYRFSTDKQKP